MAHYRRLKDLREDHDFKQDYIAKYLRIHTTTYCHYETGARELPLQCAILLAKLYHVSIDYLVQLTDLPTPQVQNVKKNFADTQARNFLEHLNQQITHFLDTEES